MRHWWIALLAGALRLAAAEPSTVILPVRIPLHGFVREAEGWIPMQHQSEWQALERSAFGQSLKAPLATRFSIRRLPIEWQTLGDHIEMRLPVSYRVELGVPKIERKTSGNVGMGWQTVSACEPAAGAVLRIETRLELLPSWAIRSRSRPILELPAPCRLQALRETVGIDITPEVRQVFNASLDRAAAELDRQIELRADLRPLAKTLWARLHDPIWLGEQVWLELHPVSVSIDRPRLENGEVRTGLRLRAEPHISGAKDNLAVVTSLPPLIPSDSTEPPTFSMDLDLDIPWADFNHRLQATMLGKILKTAGNRRLRITDISAAPSGDRLVLQVSVDGSFTGKIGLSGRPVIRDGVLSFDELRYTLSTDSMLVRFANWLRQDLYRRQFNEMARVDLVDLLAAQRGRIEESLRAGWTGDIRLEGQIDRLESGLVELTPDSVRLRARATGQLSVAVLR